MTGQQLKNSILQMAVQGKLVPQDPNDEPASVLLERIRAEKEQLIKEGKIKKERNPSIIFRGADNLPYEKVWKNEPVCIADEVPFEIPESWEWVRLGTILHKLSDGTHSRPHYVASGIPFISVKDISGGKLDFSDCKYITEEEHCELYSRCNPEYGDILLTKVGTTGIPVIVDTTNEFSLFVSVALLKFNQEMLSNEYLACLINSPLVQKQAEKNTRGVGNKNWVMRDIANTLIVIPPLLEQQRIVSKLQKILPFVDNYAHAYSKAKKLNNGFPNLLKKSILQEAVQGKLVPQDPNDEPASILLERIRAEKERLIKAGKIKRDKHESVIFRRDNSHYEKLNGIERCIDDEIPFDIPDSWCWTRIGIIFTLQAGKNISAAEIEETFQSDLYPCYGGNGIRGFVNRANRIGDYPIIGRQGALCGNINRATGEFYATEHAVCVETFCNIDVTWACFFLEALNLNQYATATAQPGLAVANINTVLIPVPPLAEQNRIKNKIEVLLPVIKIL